MRQIYKITSITAILFFIISFLYFVPTVRHRFYSNFIDFFISYKTACILPEKAYILSKNNDVIFLDARSQDEYNVSHIPNAIWIGDDDLFWKRLPEKQKKNLVIYCSVGYRSNRIGRLINDSLGLDVSNLQYGIFGWNQRKFPLTDSLELSTENVHPYSAFWGLWKW